MKKIIIDTDTASDDSAAIMLAVLSKSVEILGITTVVGNVDRRQSANNAIATVEACGEELPVYMGAVKPLFNVRKETISVHGKDGMGDCDLIHPKGTPVEGESWQFIRDMVKKYPNEVEIVTLGPVTNVALAILNDPETMKLTKHIWSMGTPGLGIGNATPVAEFNVYIDAEAYAIMLDSGIETTIAGFDLCIGEIELDKKELAILANEGNTAGKFLEKATRKLLEFNIQTRGSEMVDLPDAVAMACLIWPDYVEKTMTCHCKTCINKDETYGQVIFYEKGRTYESMPKIDNYNVTLVTKVNEQMFTERFMKLLTQ